MVVIYCIYIRNKGKIGKEKKKKLVEVDKNRIELKNLTELMLYGSVVKFIQIILIGLVGGWVYFYPTRIKPNITF